MGEFDPKLRFKQAPIARLATVTPAGVPHLVPVVFAVGGAPDHDVVYTAVDAKPKTTQRLRRLANIEANPRVSLLVDEYAEDWSWLWWVRVDGVAAIHREGAVLQAGHRHLRSKYPQYQSVPLDGPVIRAKVGDLASIYNFNGTGTLIWKLLESPRSVAELAASVVEEYDVDLAQAERDVQEFVEEMKNAGLIEVPKALAMAGD